MSRYVQDPPNAVQIELVEGCNLRCSFCGINGIRGSKREYCFMDVATATTIADKLSEARLNSRIEFAMHGEPTLNPEMFYIVSVFRDRLPKNYFMMTSNGAGLVSRTADKINKLFSCGINTLALDDYEGVNIIPRIRDNLTDHPINADVFEYPAQREGNPHARYKRSRVSFLADISRITNGTHGNLSNHCGAAAPLIDSHRNKRCTKPFRELSVRYDGRVALCCNDWRGVVQAGDLRAQSFNAVWNGEVMHSARKLLYHSGRVFSPCAGCNASSTRVGLLPDRMGKQEMPRPSKRDHEVISKSTLNTPMAVKVIRPWEN